MLGWDRRRTSQSQRFRVRMGSSAGGRRGGTGVRIGVDRQRVARQGRSICPAYSDPLRRGVSPPGTWRPARRWARVAFGYSRYRSPPYRGRRALPLAQLVAPRRPSLSRPGAYNRLCVSEAVGRASRSPLSIPEGSLQWHRTRTTRPLFPVGETCPLGLAKQRSGPLARTSEGGIVSSG